MNNALHYRLVALTVLVFVSSACGGCGDDDANPNSPIGEAPACETDACGYDPNCVQSAAADLSPSAFDDTITIQDFASSVAFLVESGTQRCIDGTLDPTRIGVVRGTVLDIDSNPIAGVHISVPSRPELGETITRADGTFDFVVASEGLLNVRAQKRGFLAVDSRTRSRQGDFAWTDPIVLTQLDRNATEVDFSSAITVARGSRTADQNGERQLAAMFREGTGVELVRADGTVESLEGPIRVRATEFTVGDSGPAAMPGALPRTTAYTYAVELSIDRAIVEGATEVRFDKPVAVYLENFLDFPTGTPVPSGFYDRVAQAWVASKDGRVVEILGTSDGSASLDIDGSGNPATEDELQRLGVTGAERRQLAADYDTGTTLWRVEVEHFTPYDFNWGFGAPTTSTPNGGTDDPDTVKDPCRQSGSIIECENRVLGEVIPIVGTSHALSYRSDRSAGSTNKTVVVHLTRDGDDVSSLSHIDLTIEIAGQRFEQRFTELEVPMSHTFVWDGNDAYGRRARTAKTAHIRVEYARPVSYTAPDPANDSNFGRPGMSGEPIGDQRAFDSVSRSFQVQLGGLDIQAAHKMGGWTLADRHVFDVFRQELYPGFGPKRSSSDNSHVVSPPYDFDAESSLPFSVVGATPEDMISAPDGTILLAISVDGQDGNQVIQYDPVDRTWSHIAGSLVDTETANECLLDRDCAEGTDAVEAPLVGAIRLAMSPVTNEVYIVDGFCVRRFEIGGSVNSVFGGCDPTDLNFEDEGSAPGFFSAVNDVAVRVDGTIVMPGFRGIWTLDPQGENLRLYADGGGSATPDNGVSIFDSSFFNASRLDVGHDDSMYIVLDGSLFLVAVDGRLESIALPPNVGVVDVNVNSEGDVYATTTWGVYLVVNGQLRPIVGGENPSDVPGSAEKDLRIKGDNIAAPVFLGQMYFSAISSTDELFLVTVAPGTLKASFRDVHYLFNNLRAGRQGVLVPSEDGSLLYEFANNGRHLATLNGIDGSVELDFDYDRSGRLLQLTDRDGLVTHFNYTDGELTQIVGPYGHETTTELHDDLLIGVVDPDGVGWTMAYTDARLTEFTDRNGNASQFTYDEAGKLVRDTDAAGGFKELERVGDNVRLTTKMGRTWSYNRRQRGTGVITRTVTSPSGLERRVTDRHSWTKTVEQPDGTKTDLLYAPDPRYGLLAPYLTQATTTLPSGNSLVLEQVREAELADPRDPLSVQKITTVSSANDAETTHTYDVGAQTLTTVTPEGRQVVTTLNDDFRPVRVERAGRLPIEFAYDADGRLSSAAQGNRVTKYGYDPTNGWLNRTTDALAQSMEWTHDAIGRVTTETLPDGQETNFRYDDAGNVTDLTVPTGERHSFDYSSVDLLETETTPLNQNTTSYRYNDDHQVTGYTLPDGRHVEIGYDAGGRVTSVTTPRGIERITYDDTTGTVAEMETADGQKLSMTYDGSLPLTLTYEGEVSGTIARTYDAFWRTASRTVNGAHAVDFTYDMDGYTTQIGRADIERDSSNGVMTGLTLGDVETHYSYTEFGELDVVETTYNNVILLRREFGRDLNGLVTEVTETIDNQTTVYGYRYDDSGRLLQELQNGVTTERYGYDENDNLLLLQTDGNVNHATQPFDFDAEDRLVAVGNLDFEYNAHGQLARIPDTDVTLTYDYDVFDRLQRFTFADNDTEVVTYGYDPQGRRISKTVNGVFQWGLLYNGVAPLAQVDAQGNVTSRFVYAEHGHVPSYMERGGKTYRFVTDHLGSVRRVVDISNGTVVQELTYTPYGHVRTDTNSGFQPFGFAGGLYDRETRMVRFGSRDYLPLIGRWTTKDKLGFAAGDTNLYAYSYSNPINYSDPTGDYVDTIIDVIDLGVTVGTLINDNVINDCDNLGENLLGVGLSIAGIALPGVAGLGVGYKAGKAAAAAKRACSFPEGTDVVMCDGSRRDITEVSTGDQVLSMNDVTGEIGCSEVTEPYANVRRAIVELEVRDETGVQHVIETTANHPFYVYPADSHQFVENVDDAPVMSLHGLTPEQESALACAMDRGPPTPHGSNDGALSMRPESLAQIASTQTSQDVHDRQYFTSIDRNRGWTRVDTLRSGDQIPSANGDLLTVVESRPTGRIEPVYNFGVENTHSYFVGDSAAWVHNTIGCINDLKEHLTPRDLDAARRELLGEVVARKPNGTPYDHVHEVVDAQQGLYNQIKAIKRKLASPSTKAPERPALEAKLGEASRTLDHANKFVPSHHRKNKFGK